MSVDRPGDSGGFRSSTTSPDATSDAQHDEAVPGVPGAGASASPPAPNGGHGPNGSEVSPPDELSSVAPEAPSDTPLPPLGPGGPVPFVDLKDVTPPPGPGGSSGRWMRPNRARTGRPRKPAEGRWVNYRVRTLGPMSVLRLAGLFYICIWLALVVASVVLWNVGRSTETIDQFEGFITRLGAYGECVPEDTLEPGTDFERDDDCPDGAVLVDGFTFDDGILFRAFFFGGIVLVVGGTLLTTLVVMLYNLLSEVTGGVRYTATREPRNAPIRSPGPRLRR